MLEHGRIACRSMGGQPSGTVTALCVCTRHFSVEPYTERAGLDGTVLVNLSTHPLRPAPAPLWDRRKSRCPEKFRRPGGLSCGDAAPNPRSSYSSSCCECPSRIRRSMHVGWFLAIRFAAKPRGPPSSSPLVCSFLSGGPLGPARTSCRTIEPAQTLSFTSAGKFPGPIRFEIGDEPRRVVCAPSATRCRRGPTSRNPRNQPGREREPTMNRNRRRARLRALPCDPVRFIQHPADVCEQRVLALVTSGAATASDLMTGDAPAALPGVAHPSNIPGRAPLE